MIAAKINPSTDDKIRLTPGQKNVLAWARIEPLRRVTGGWCTRAGDFVTKRQADSLQRAKYLSLIHLPKSGPRLVLTAAGLKEISR